MAYQGFGDGIAEDGAVVGLFVAAGLDFFVATSFSKSFSLYGERVGALSRGLRQRKDEAARVLSQLKRVIRTNYSNPPTHGAAGRRRRARRRRRCARMWEEELAGMRERIKRDARRAASPSWRPPALQQRHRASSPARSGMFSYSGLTKAQMQRLRSEFGVYGVDSGRICVAALNENNLDAVVAAIVTSHAEGSALRP